MMCCWYLMFVGVDVVIRVDVYMFWLVDLRCCNGVVCWMVCGLLCCSRVLLMFVVMKVFVLFNCWLVVLVVVG